MSGGRILVVCALHEELRGWSRPPSVDAVATGIGPVEAACATAVALAGAEYGAVVNAGLAGAFRHSALRIGDAVLVAEECLAGIGLEDGSEIILPRGARLVERTAANADMLARVQGLAFPLASGLTVTTVTGTEATAERLARRYGADVETMEGFAVLRACERAGVPAVQIRGVSNYVGPRSQSGWDFAAGSRACVSAIEAVLSSLGMS